MHNVGWGIFMIAVGAILAFAVKASLPGLYLDVVGYILMAAGLAIAIIGAIRSSSVRRVAPAGTARQVTTVREDEVL